MVVGGFVSWKFGWFGKSGLTSGDQMKWDAPIVAILPFDAVDGGKEENRLADELTSETINRVSQLPGTRIISRGAVMPYKVAPGGPARKRIRAIDAELGGVTAIMEGSIDRTGDELKINTVLYDAKTEQRLWGYTYRRDWNDASAVEKEVPDQIAHALRTRFAAARRETTGAAGLARADRRGPVFSGVADGSSRPESQGPARAGNCQGSQVCRGVRAVVALRIYRRTLPTCRIRRRNWRRRVKTGEELNRKALALDPDCVAALVHLSEWRREAGAVEEADAMLDRALKLEPTFMRANLFTGFRAKSPDEAYAYVRRAHAMEPEVRRVMFFLYEHGPRNISCRRWPTAGRRKSTR